MSQALYRKHENGGIYYGYGDSIAAVSEFSPNSSVVLAQPFKFSTEFSMDLDKLLLKHMEKQELVIAITFPKNKRPGVGVRVGDISLWSIL